MVQAGRRLRPPAHHGHQPTTATKPGGYPYGGFGAGQRARDFEGSKAQANLVAGGSPAPLGRA
nr:hypothetical protein [Streptomyces sp. 846.5]